MNPTFLVIAAALFGVLLGFNVGRQTAPDPDRPGLDEVACQAATGYAAQRARDWLQREGGEGE